jgi:hypothetical protein
LATTAIQQGETVAAHAVTHRLRRYFHMLEHVGTKMEAPGVSTAGPIDGDGGHSLLLQTEGALFIIVLNVIVTFISELPVPGLSVTERPRASRRQRLRAGSWGNP